MYIGETSHHLLKHIEEHKEISIRTCLTLSNPPYSNIRDHALHGHNIEVLSLFSISQKLAVLLSRKLFYPSADGDKNTSTVVHYLS